METVSTLLSPRMNPSVCFHVRHVSVCVLEVMSLFRGAARRCREVCFTTKEAGGLTYCDGRRGVSRTQREQPALLTQKPPGSTTIAQRQQPTQHNATAPQGKKNKKNNKKTGIVKRGRRKNDNPFCRQAHVQKWADKRTNYTKVDHGMSYISEKL